MATGPRYTDELPQRVRLLIIGGGIHGVGLLHDMASRGWTDIHLVDKTTLGFGTSSRSTKLVHGGLRYLKRITDFGLVSEALRERRVLMELAPDLVNPVELLLPILKKGGMPRYMVKAGLTLYDRLAGKYRLNQHRMVPTEEVLQKAPMLDVEKLGAVYSFWDAQTDDLELVGRVGASARHLGAGITEGCEALAITPTDDGWNVQVRLANGVERTISALYVVNAAGPWANALLERSGVPPTHRAINNKGSHLLFPDIGLKAGLFLQSATDTRIFFLLPWQGHTLLGTTEELYEGDPDAVAVTEQEVEYLLKNCNRFLTRPLTTNDVVKVFAGLRWLAVEAGHTLTETTRSYVVGERASKRGLLMTLYGGKLTTYRNLSQTLGDRITRHFGEFRASRTDQATAWLQRGEAPGAPLVAQRFSNPA